MSTQTEPEESPSASSLPKPGTYHCADCQKARDSPDYEQRLSNLRRQFYCGECKRDHAAVNFSASQRRSDSRKCIGHEGHVKVCRHWNLTWSDLTETDWPHHKRANFEIDVPPGEASSALVQCTHPDHRATRYFDYPNRRLLHKYEAPGLVIEKKENYINLDFVYAMDPWLDFEDEDEQIKTCLAHAVGSIDSIKICPHMDANRFGDPARLRTHYSPDHNTHSHLASCLVCHFALAITLGAHADRGPEIPLTCFISCSQVGMEDALRWYEWQLYVDPHSYGHFSDPETQNITWCEDKQCATTFEFLQAAACFELVLPTPIAKVQERRPFKQRLDHFTRTLVKWWYNPQSMPPHHGDEEKALFEDLPVE